MTSVLYRLRDRLHAKSLALLPEPTPTNPTINSIEQYESGVSAEILQAVMAWLFASLINAGYYGQSYLYWLHPQAESDFSSASAGVSLFGLSLRRPDACTALRFLLAVNARTYIDADLPA